MRASVAGAVASAPIDVFLLAPNPEPGRAAARDQIPVPAAASSGRAMDPGRRHAVQPELHPLLRLLGPRHRTPPPARAGGSPRAGRGGAAARSEGVLLHRRRTVRPP